MSSVTESEELNLIFSVIARFGVNRKPSKIAGYNRNSTLEYGQNRLTEKL